MPILKINSRTFDALHYHRSRRSSTVADSRHAVLARSELMQQCGQDSRARATECMAERDGTAERIDV